MLFLALGLHFYTWSGPSGNRRHGVLEQSPSMWPDGQAGKTCNISGKGVVKYADNVAVSKVNTQCLKVCIFNRKWLKLKYLWNKQKNALKQSLLAGDGGFLMQSKAQFTSVIDEN